MSPRTLHTKINQILFFVATGLFSIVFLLTGISEYRETKTEYASAIQARINVAKALIGKVLFQTDIVVQAALQDNPLRQDLLSHLETSHLFALHGDIFYVLDPLGKVVSISKPFNSFKGLDFSSMVSTALSSDRQVLHHYQSIVTNRSVITIQYPISDGYLLVVERSLSTITQFMTSFEKGKLFPGELFFVLSDKGRTIYHPEQTLIKTRHNLAFDLKELSKPDNLGFFSFVYQGKKYIAIREHFTEPNSWIIYYSIPYTVITLAIKNIFFRQLLFLLFFFTLFFYIFRFVISRYFSTPINNIVAALKVADPEARLSFSQEMADGILEFDTIIKAIKSRDQEISHTAERFQAVLNSLDAVVYVADLTTHELLFINIQGLKQYGNDAVGRKCYTVLQQATKQPCSFCTNKILVDPTGMATGVHIREYQDENTRQWFECRDQAIRWTDGRLVRLGITVDISIRKETETALQTEKERLNVTLQSIGDGVITTDVKGKILFLNKMAENLCGWTNEEAQGKPSSIVFNIINEKTGLKCASPIQRVMHLGRIIGLANHTALIAKDGTIRSIADSGAPIRDKESNIIGVVLVFRDVTHEQMLEEELLKTKKLESIGVLAGGIAHDFNNILSAILGNIELAGYRIAKEDTRTVSLLAEAEKATKRATKLTGQLLTFSKGGEPVKEPTSLAEMVTESANFVLHGSNIVCNYSFPEDLWMVEVDSGQIGQVIQNITINAKHAMPEGGTIVVHCANVTDTAAETLLSVDAGDYVRISIQDNGVGIPKAILDKIFDPYFTTKQEGSGLGLAICHSIINKHEGYITVSSNIGKGTIFTIYLPAIRSQATDRDNTEEASVRAAVRSATIMVMDDEKMLRDVAALQLSTLGHKAILVEDGLHAINKYQELQDSGTPVDIVIMDLTIPGGMGGQEAAEKLLKIDPDAKIIVASGYSNDPVMASYHKHGFIAAITKPFDLRQLSDTIAPILN